MLAEDHGGKSRVHHGGASVDNSSVEQLSSGTVDRTPTNPASIRGSSVSCSFQGTVDCWETLQNSGFSSEATNILLAAWRGSTKKQIKTFHKKWFSLCRERKINQFQISVNHVIEFMTMLYHNSSEYS